LSSIIMVYSPTAPIDDDPPSYDAVISSPICNRSFGSVQEDFSNILNQNHDVGNADIGFRLSPEFRSANRTHVEAFNDITDVINNVPILEEDDLALERRGRSERGTLTKKGLYWRLAVIILLGIFMAITIGALIYILVNSEKVNKRLDSFDQQGLDKLKEDVNSLNRNWSQVSEDFASLDNRLTNIKNKLLQLEHRIERVENSQGIEVLEYRSSGCLYQNKVLSILGMFALALEL